MQCHIADYRPAAGDKGLQTRGAGQGRETRQAQLTCLGRAQLRQLCRVGHLLQKGVPAEGRAGVGAPIVML